MSKQVAEGLPAAEGGRRPTGAAGRASCQGDWARSSRMCPSSSASVHGPTGPRFVLEEVGSGEEVRPARRW